MILALVSSGIWVSFEAEKAKTIQQNETDIEPGGDSKLHALVIHELMSANDGAVADAFGDSEDWIELYNGTDHAIDLTNFGLSDTLDKTKWIFPSVIIPAKGYLVIMCGKSAQSSLSANFNLKREGGDRVVLRDAGGMVIDQVTLPALDKNTVLARNTFGEWVVLDTATPGFPNTTVGFDAYLQSITKTTSLIKINEVLPVNNGQFTIGNQYPGYIEIINTGSIAVNLKNYALGDDIHKPFQWKFPSRMLEPGATLVVYTDNINQQGDPLEANFSLSSKNGSVFLADNTGHLIDRVDYAEIENGYSIQKTNGLSIVSPAISPGYPNTIQGITAFQNTLIEPDELIINEVMTKNNSTLLHNGANAYSWVELKNNTDHAVTLSDYALSDSDNRMDAVTLPNVQLLPGEMIVLMASGNAALSTAQYRHLDLKLSGDESVYLFHGNRICDSLFAALTALDVSYGRSSAHGFTYMTQSTPKQENIDGSRAVSISAQSDKAAGVYEETSLAVNLSGEGTIHYTTDGSTPTRNSPVYASELIINHTTVLKTVTLEEGKLPSAMTSLTYVINEGLSLPVVSLSIDAGRFNDLNRHPDDLDYEVPAHVEYFDGQEGFSVDCGIQLFGGSARYFPKKSFSLEFKSKYGTDQLEYPVFSKRDYSVFDTLVLRSGSQDYKTTFFRDLLGSSVMEDSETVEVQAYQSVVLFINGQYWGLYDFREKVDDDFIATHKNVDESTVSIVRIDGSVAAGTRTDYDNMMRYVRTHDLSIDANYDHLATLLNMDSYIDFWIGEIFTANNDMLNIRFYSSPAYDDGRLSMIFYDLDFAWYFPWRDFYAYMTDPEGMHINPGMPGPIVSTELNRALFTSEKFKTRFLERLSLNLATIWNEETVMAKLETLVTDLGPEIRRDFIRWDQDPETWDGNVEVIRTFIRKRTATLLKQTKAFFGLSTAEYQHYFGGL